MRRVRTFFFTGGGGAVTSVAVVVAVSAKSRVDATMVPIPLSCRWRAGAKERHGRVRRPAVIIVIVGEIFIGYAVYCQAVYIAVYGCVFGLCICSVMVGNGAYFSVKIVLVLPQQ
mmetsp:Transcript_26732/g.48460  ORF Transcript_26732/g.48460 Transcript_26732/m.48460 type:complete len:115 (-) Transcript_26732:92-436(-)